jgi:hypothetical protein
MSILPRHATVYSDYLIKVLSPLPLFVTREYQRYFTLNENLDAITQRRRQKRYTTRASVDFVIPIAMYSCYVLKASRRICSRQYFH